MFHLYPIALSPMLHERLKELRQVLKFSQDRMAEVLGMSQPAYCNLEKGHTQRLPSEGRLRRLVRRAGVSFERVDLAGNVWTHATQPWTTAHADKGSPGSLFSGAPATATRPRA